MAYLFTSESVSPGHPDKVADQISDALLDCYLAFDPNSKVAIETLVGANHVVLAGEFESEETIDIEQIVRNKIESIGYVDKTKFGGFTGKECDIKNLIQNQSEELADNQKDKTVAGDQGIMFGFATNQTKTLMPLPIYLAHKILYELTNLRKSGEIPYLGPDAKSQVTIEFDENHKPLRINNIVISTLHEEGISLDKIKQDLKSALFSKLKEKLPANISNLFDDQIIYHINPAGTWAKKGGPIADSGLTGRKIIVDTYGGRGAHGGGAFSGKDSSKVDRSGAYMARYIAKNLVQAQVAKQVLVQLSYIIGKPEPSSIFVDTYGTLNPELKNGKSLTDARLAHVVKEIFSDQLSVEGITDFLKLKNPMFSETAVFGHMGRSPRKVSKTFHDAKGKQQRFDDMELFTWERLDHIQIIKNQIF